VRVASPVRLARVAVVGGPATVVARDLFDALPVTEPAPLERAVVARDRGDGGSERAPRLPRARGDLKGLRRRDMRGAALRVDRALHRDPAAHGAHGHGG